MAGEKQIIYYSTIHLTRREDILVQSIISLYRSKDGFGWVHSDLVDSAVVIVGTGANALLKLDKDPFEGIQKEQVICILGDAFYPKNARAVVHIDLPIKALIFVDQLSYIERSYINQPISMGYVASNFLAQQTLQSRIDAQLEELSVQSNKGTVLNKNGMIDFVPRNSKEEIEESFTAEVVNKNTESINISTQDTKKPILTSILKNETVKKDAFSFNLEAGLYKDSDEAKLTAPSLDPVVLEEKIVNDETLTQNTNNEVIAKKPPVLTEAIIDDSTWEALLKGKTIPNKLDIPAAPVVASAETVQDTSIELASALAVSKADNETSAEVANIQENITLSTDINTPETSQLRRIKLLRWPKSEVIQRHPGNAILASMVINMPMSVSDMAKQSDLPLQICQRFMDAVIEFNVAEYVDDVPLTTESSKSETTEAEVTIKVEEVSKRKGILYRIRAALGLLRK